MKLYNRETSYYTIITIPKCLVSKYGKKQIWRSLNTKDYKLAKLRAELETMSIRRKLLNDLNKQKEKTSKALDFAQILDDDDDDFFEDDIDIKDTVILAIIRKKNLPNWMTFMQWQICPIKPMKNLKK